MKKIIVHSINFLFLFISLYAFAQNETHKGYRIEGDEIVFTFNKSDYKKITSDGFGNKQDFDDLKIDNVVVSGKFNNWSKNKWRMAKVNNNTYELRKKLSDFTDEFSWEFKFVINNYYWAEPSKDDINITRATKDGFYLNTYNLHFLTNYPDKNGNAHFKLKGYKNAKKVILSGTFNRWNEELFKMNKTEEGWELTLLLKPGEYEYKFIVDGNWMEDPDNPLKKRNEFNGFNSLININKLITFKLDNHLNAKKVILSGSFNNWDENNYSMLKTKSGWEYSIKLSGGKHHYKFIVDGNWIVDPKNSVKEYDYDGNINSVCIIK